MRNHGYTWAAMGTFMDTSWFLRLTRPAVALPCAVLVLGLCVAGASANWLHNSRVTQAQIEFQRHTERLADQVALRVREVADGLNGARGLFSANSSVRRADFRAFFEARDLPREYPGVRGFAFTQRVLRADLDPFIAAARADDGSDFEVRNIGSLRQGDLYVVQFAEPASHGAAMVGVDLGSEPARRDALERALRSGEATLSAPLTLVRRESTTPGYLLALPVYRRGTDPVTPGMRVNLLRGMLSAPIVVSDLLKGITDAAGGMAEFELLDPASSAASPQRVFDSTSDQTLGLGESSAAPTTSRFEATGTVAVPSRNLILHAHSTPQFDVLIDDRAPWLLFIAIALASALLTATLRHQIGGRRRAEAAALRMTTELEQLAAVVRHTSNSVLIADREMRIVWVNEGFTRLSGYTLEEAAGKTPGELLSSPSADPATLETLANGVAAGTRCSVEIENRAKDGRAYWISTEVQPRRDAQGQLTGFMEIGSDITARRHAEAEVQRSSALLRAAIDAIDEAFVLFDPNDRLVFCNDKYRQIYPGMAHLMVPGATFEEIIRTGAERGEYLEAVGRADAWVAERLAAHRSCDATLVQKLDTGRTLRIVERKMPDGHIVGFRIDITELVQATEAARAASQAKSQFLANMSHEIRTPMNAILGMLNLLQRTELNLRQADYANKAEGAARALLHLLNDILDFSKVEAGKMTLDPQPFRIDQLLRDLSVILSTYVGQKRVEVLFDVDPALSLRLVGDVTRLRQVLINLGGNAIKFTEQGTVLVSLTLLERDAAAVTLHIAVRDDGIGIAPENHARIFSGFTQAEASTTRRFGGTGLGLAISQRLVALMGGELRVDSAVGKGSCFHFSVKLPIATEVLEQPANSAAPVAPLRVLVVDDNPSAREALMRMGQSLGWQISVAESGERALEVWHAQAVDAPFQAVFVDWQMPGLDGWQTSQRIRAFGLSGQTPVIVMVTAHGREMLAQRSPAEQASLDGFLVKPVTASMLSDALTEAWRGSGQPAPLATRVAAGRLAGVRLLLTEDNLNNQQVARELLEGEGAFVQIANNGQEAVQALAGAAPPFDAVLMDLQMPVMDGFTATRQIRSQLSLNLPIVAMTANAMASDREACLAAGMNNHVGKPFDLDKLVRVLRKHTGREAQDGGAALSAIVPLLGAHPANTDALLSEALAQAATAAGVDVRAALGRLGGKSDVYRRMLQTFVKDLATMPELLRGFAEQADASALARLLHTLKGLAATLGATTLADAAAQGEKQLVTAPIPDTPSADITCTAQRAIEAVIAARPGLEALLLTLQPAQPEARPAQGGMRSLEFPDRRAVMGALQAMVIQLENGDMSATDAIIDMRQRFGTVMAEELEPIDDAIGALDFARARRVCDALIGELMRTRP